ncbi:Hypothetical predicted protein [Olea europaea subsp. europaea]|uniref:Uncharacterized protein n=1 Tax=Olea europaea subsp. europaea TaxID=158383 RepID=A0A8S0UBM8_OLEEU|nr:Hypothetical predicted protein [Olea europaea subsp. europaea]
MEETLRTEANPETRFLRRFRTSASRNVSSVQALGYGMIPERSGIQLSGSNTTQSAAGPFPDRTDFLFVKALLKSLSAHINPCRLSVAAGDVIPLAKGDFQSQASSVLYPPSLSRRANENSLAAPLVQRPKIVSQFVKHHSGTYQQKYIPHPIPAVPLHTKRQGLEEPH